MPSEFPEEEPSFQRSSLTPSPTWQELWTPSAHSRPSLCEAREFLSKEKNSGGLENLLKSTLYRKSQDKVVTKSENLYYPFKPLGFDLRDLVRRAEGNEEQ